MAEQHKRKWRSASPAPVSRVTDVAGGTPRIQPSRGQTTMAVVFSDIVGSTALRNRLGEVAFTPLREAHDAVAADLVEACGGQVVRWQGDGLVVAFSSA